MRRVTPSSFAHRATAHSTTGSITGVPCRRSRSTTAHPPSARAANPSAPNAQSNGRIALLSVPGSSPVAAASSPLGDPASWRVAGS